MRLYCAGITLFYTLFVALLLPSCVLAGNTTLPLPGAMRQQTCKTVYQLRLGVSFDHMFCARYGTTFGVAAHLASTAIAQVEKMFLNQACVQLSIVFITGFCNKASDPYSNIDEKMDESDILNEFKNKFKQPEGVAEKADLNILFTGTISIGSAVESSVCSDEAFAFVSVVNLFRLIQQLARALSSQYIGRSPGSHIMHPVILSVEPWLFLPESRSNITSYAGSDKGTCMARTTGTITHPLPAIVGGTTFSSCAALKPGAKDDLYKGEKISILPRVFSERFRIKIRQKKNTVRVTFKGISNVFTALAFRLSSVPNLRSRAIGEVRYFGDGKKVIKFKVPYESIIPTEASPMSCCGQKVYIYYKARRCDQNNLHACEGSTFGSSSVSYTMECTQ